MARGDEAAEPISPVPLYRRRVLRRAGAGIAVTGLAGCTSVTHYEFSASPVVLPEDTRQQLGYRERLHQPIDAQRNRTVGGVEVHVTVESHVSTYEASDEADRLTTQAPSVGVVSTPTAAVEGESFNPLVRLSLSELLANDAGRRLLTKAGVTELGHSRSSVRWVRGPTFIAGREGTCLDTKTRLESYGGVLKGDPSSVVFVHLTRVQADSVVIAAAVHGRDVEEPDLAFVGPDSSYLTPDALDRAVSRFGSVADSLVYERANDGGG